MPTEARARPATERPIATVLVLLLLLSAPAIQPVAGQVPGPDDPLGTAGDVVGAADELSGCGPDNLGQCTLWQEVAGDEVLAVTYGPDGDVLYVVDEGGVAARDAETGSVHWRAEAAGGGAADAVVHDGAVYVKTGGDVLALDTGDGSLRWERDGISEAHDLAVSAQGVLFEAGTHVEVRALDVDDGSTIWTNSTDVWRLEIDGWDGCTDDPGSTLALHPEGSTIYVTRGGTCDGSPLATAAYEAGTGDLSWLNTHPTFDEIFDDFEYPESLEAQEGWTGVDVEASPDGTRVHVLGQRRGDPGVVVTYDATNGDDLWASASVDGTVTLDGSLGLGVPPVGQAEVADVRDLTVTSSGDLVAVAGVLDGEAAVEVRDAVAGSLVASRRLGEVHFDPLDVRLADDAGGDGILVAYGSHRGDGGGVDLELLDPAAGWTASTWTGHLHEGRMAPNGLAVHGRSEMVALAATDGGGWDPTGAVAAFGLGPLARPVQATGDLLDAAYEPVTGAMDETWEDVFDELEDEHGVEEVAPLRKYDVWNGVRPGDVVVERDLVGDRLLNRAMNHLLYKTGATEALPLLSVETGESAEFDLNVTRPDRFAVWLGNASKYVNYTLHFVPAQGVTAADLTGMECAVGADDGPLQGGGPGAPAGVECPLDDRVAPDSHLWDDPVVVPRGDDVSGTDDEEDKLDVRTGGGGAQFGPIPAVPGRYYIMRAAATPDVPVPYHAERYGATVRQGDGGMPQAIEISAPDQEEDPEVYGDWAEASAEAVLEWAPKLVGDAEDASQECSSSVTGADGTVDGARQAVRDCWDSVCGGDVIAACFDVDVCLDADASDVDPDLDQKESACAGVGHEDVGDALGSDPTSQAVPASHHYSRTEEQGQPMSRSDCPTRHGTWLIPRDPKNEGVSRTGYDDHWDDAREEERNDDVFSRIWSYDIVEWSQYWTYHEDGGYCAFDTETIEEVAYTAFDLDGPTDLDEPGEEVWEVAVHGAARPEGDTLIVDPTIYVTDTPEDEEIDLSVAATRKKSHSNPDMKKRGTVGSWGHGSCSTAGLATQAVVVYHTWNHMIGGWAGRLVTHACLDLIESWGWAFEGYNATMAGGDRCRKGCMQYHPYITGDEPEPFAYQVVWDWWNPTGGRACTDVYVGAAFHGGIVYKDQEFGARVPGEASSHDVYRDRWFPVQSIEAEIPVCVSYTPGEEIG